jgi:hypothetical protein
MSLPQTAIQEIVSELRVNGIVRLPNFLTSSQLSGMQCALDVRLKQMRWNQIDGYEMSDPYRYMLDDILLLDQGFVDAVLHPTVKGVLSAYLDDPFQLVEAKGWQSNPSMEDFHGWHADAWYDPTICKTPPKEVKLAIYLSDVTSGNFVFIKGSHTRGHAPGYGEKGRYEPTPADEMVEMFGSAGSAFLFDTSGIHRQAFPILQPRRAIFCNYHDSRIPLQKEDWDSDRYHPLLLNAAFLGNLSEDDQRILGFGDKGRYQPAYERKNRHVGFQSAMQTAFNVKLKVDGLYNRVRNRLRRLFSPRPR